jgi:hypothetical protein
MHYNYELDMREDSLLKLFFFRATERNNNKDQGEKKKKREKNYRKMEKVEKKLIFDI